MAVGTQEGDSVTVPRSGGAECGCKAGATLRKLRVGKLLISADDAGLFRKLFTCVSQKADGSERQLHMRLASQDLLFSSATASCCGRRRISLMPAFDISRQRHNGSL